MTRKSRIAFYGALVVVLAAVVYVVKEKKAAGPPTKVLRTTITLVPTGAAGTCGIPGEVAKIIAKDADDVTFHVVNRCDAAYVVRVGNFRPNGTGSPNDNVFNGMKSKSIPAGGSDDITGKADKQGQHSIVVYKYDIFIKTGGGPETTAKDPDYEIWP